MIEVLKQRLKAPIAQVLGVSEEFIEKSLEIPKDIQYGQVAMPVFRWAKELKKAPPQIAIDVAEKLKSESLPQVISITPVAGFVNFQFDDLFLQELIFSACEQKGDKIGDSKDGEGETIVIDYSSPNIAKPMSVGHLRATMIGQAICNIARSQGYEVKGVNHLGDWGVQFGRLVYAYRMWSSEYDFEGQPFKSLFDIYVRFHEEMESNPELEKEGSLIFKALENGDKEIEKLWERFIEISLAEYNNIYELLGIRHDYTLGESFYNDKMKPAEKTLEDAGLLVESEGAMVVRLDDEKMPPCLIRKSDGASLYATRDIACALYRRHEMGGDRLLYVVGADQGLHFKQVFSVMEKLDESWAGVCRHVSFGMYKFGSEKMSTRKGNVVFLRDIVDKAIAMCEQIIEEKNPALEDKQKVAQQVGIGAVIFNDLSGDSIKDVKFEWSKVLDFEGDSGPYIQYSGVRCRSLLEKYGQAPLLKAQVPLESDAERELVRHLLTFSEVVGLAYQKFKPHFVALYALDLAKAFNNFYQKCPILNSTEELKRERMALVQSSFIVLKKSLALLNIQVPDRM